MTCHLNVFYKYTKFRLNTFSSDQFIERTQFCARQTDEWTDGRMLLHLDSCWVQTMLEKVAKKA